jgi:hypothetical protein
VPTKSKQETIMKTTIAIVIALSALSTAALAGRSDYGTFSDIRPLPDVNSPAQTHMLAVPFIVKKSTLAPSEDSGSEQGKAR